MARTLSALMVAALALCGTAYAEDVAKPLQPQAPPKETFLGMDSETGVGMTLLSLKGALGFSTNKVTEATNLNEPLKLLVAGLGSTGTMSVQAGLEQIGYKTYHTKQMVWHRQVPLWNKLWEGETLESAGIFDALASHGYNATLDVPCGLFTEQMLAKYPDAKVILTVRDSPERWHRSAARWFPVWIRFQDFPMGLIQGVQNMVKMEENVFKDLSDNYARDGFMRSEEDSVLAYNQHIENVKAVVPEDQLLVFNVKQGWAPVCEFLELDECPEGYFPHINDGDGVKQILMMLNIMRVVGTVSVILVAAIFIVCLQKCCTSSKRASEKKAKKDQ